jgi:hypothetical protein
MKLKYNVNYFYSLIYDVNCSNISYYRYLGSRSSTGWYKNKWFGLYFWKGNRKITNNKFGVKINY